MCHGSAMSFFSFGDICQLKEEHVVVIPSNVTKLHLHVQAGNWRRLPPGSPERNRGTQLDHVTTSSSSSSILHAALWESRACSRWFIFSGRPQEQHLFLKSDLKMHNVKQASLKAPSAAPRPMLLPWPQQ